LTDETQSTKARQQESLLLLLKLLCVFLQQWTSAIHNRPFYKETYCFSQEWHSMSETTKDFWVKTLALFIRLSTDIADRRQPPPLAKKKKKGKRKAKSICNSNSRRTAVF